MNKMSGQTHFLAKYFADKNLQKDTAQDILDLLI